MSLSTEGTAASAHGCIAAVERARADFVSMHKTKKQYLNTMCRRIVVIIDVAILSTIISISIWAQEVCPFAFFTMAAESSPLTAVSALAGEDDNPAPVAVEIGTAASAPQSPFDSSDSEDRPRVPQARNTSWWLLRCLTISVVTGAPGMPPTRRIKAYLLMEFRWRCLGFRRSERPLAIGKFGNSLTHPDG